MLLRATSESGSLPADGPGVSAITDHAFVPRGEWWSRCGFMYGHRWGEYTKVPCGLAEAAHASTIVRRDNPHLDSPLSP